MRYALHFYDLLNFFVAIEFEMVLVSISTMNRSETLLLYTTLIYCTFSHYAPERVSNTVNGMFFNDFSLEL